MLLGQQTQFPDCPVPVQIVVAAGERAAQSTSDVRQARSSRHTSTSFGPEIQPVLQISAGHVESTSLSVSPAKEHATLANNVRINCRFSTKRPFGEVAPPAPQPRTDDTNTGRANVKRMASVDVEIKPAYLVTICLVPTRKTISHIVLRSKRRLAHYEVNIQAAKSEELVANVRVLGARGAAIR
jgi:hypothetical protein